MGDFVIFSYFFRISGLEGFLSSIPGTRNRKPYSIAGEMRPLRSRFSDRSRLRDQSLLIARFVFFALPIALPMSSVAVFPNLDLFKNLLMPLFLIRSLRNDNKRSLQ